MSGYGVALDLKKMEYLAVDDRSSVRSEPSRLELVLSSHLPVDSEDSSASSDSESIGQVDPIVTLLHQYPENETADYTSALTPEELLYIGMQSAQLIYDSTNQDLEDSAPIHDPVNALKTLKQLSQNFPKYASTLARRVVVDEGLQDELLQNGRKVQSGGNAVWINGVAIQDKDMNPFS